ncbi:MAG TPA: hypothetical protein VGN20_10245 [Mucilaginibacter sp.]|jgi:hypothetical protein
MTNDLEAKATERQKEICAKYDADFFQSPFSSIIGIALETFDKSVNAPVHGLRHTIESDRAVSWYIWMGEFSG